MRTLLIVVALLTVLGGLGCSGSEDGEEQSALRKEQERIAAAAVSAMKTPIDQAKIAKELTDSHNRAVQGQLEQQ